jgi:hypothetical protein
MARIRKKLNFKCTDTDCGSGLHCFKATGEMIAQNKTGQCRQCGIQLVNWERIHSRDIRDVENTLAMLKTEFVRHKFWHIRLSVRAINHARRKGKTGLRERLRKHLAAAIGAAHPFRDGFQTPMKENADDAIAYSQHATATCCRKCLEYWHGIPLGRELTHDELNYLTELAAKYFEDRLPSLTEHGEHIPPIRHF